MAPLKLAALFLSLGSLALPQVDAVGDAVATDVDETALKAINLLRTGKINSPMNPLSKRDDKGYVRETEMEKFIAKDDCTLNVEEKPKEGFWTKVDKESLELKDYLTIFDQLLTSLDKLSNSANPSDDRNGYDDDSVSNLAFLVSSKATHAGCGVVTGCTEANSQVFYLFCTFFKESAAMRTSYEGITGAPTVDKNFLERMKERKAAGIDLASLTDQDMDTRLPTPTTPESGVFKVVPSIVVIAASALSFLWL